MAENSDPTCASQWRQFAYARWLSPDPAALSAVNPNDPQSWNRYAYVENQPLSATDPLGLCGSPNGPTCGQVLAQSGATEGSGCIGAPPGSPIFQACGGYRGYAGGGSWGPSFDEFDLLALQGASPTDTESAWINGVFVSSTTHFSNGYAILTLIVDENNSSIPSVDFAQVGGRTFNLQNADDRALYTLALAGQQAAPVA